MVNHRFAAALAAVAGAALVAGSGEAMASGYALKEQSGSLLGQAFAGMGATAEDPSVIFFNPAGMSQLDGNRVTGILSAVLPVNRFHNDDSSFAVLPSALLGTNESGDAAQDAIIPAFYAMTQIDDFNLGVGVNVPFGLTTDYDDDWIGRYAAITSELLTINVNPVVSYRVTDWLSVGAGAQIQYIDARLTNAVFFGVGLDGKSELKADDVGYGATAGVLLEPLRGTRIGVGWRSQINHKLDGDAKVETPAGANIIDTGADAEVTTPESVSLSLHHDINEQWAVVSTIEWTNWSRFDELRVKFDNNLPNDVTEENWRDTWFHALGLNYRPTAIPDLTLRTGVALDETPVKDSHRTARVPDEDRYWLSVGLTYEVTEAFTFDLGYTHIFIKDAEIDEDFGTGVGAGTLDGEYHNSVDILALQANLKF